MLGRHGSQGVGTQRGSALRVRTLNVVHPGKIGTHGCQNSKITHHFCQFFVKIYIKKLKNFSTIFLKKISKMLKKICQNLVKVAFFVAKSAKLGGSILKIRPSTQGRTLNVGGVGTQRARGGSAVRYHVVQAFRSCPPPDS